VLRSRLAIFLLFSLLIVAGLILWRMASRQQPTAVPVKESTPKAHAMPSDPTAPTEIFAHNLLLRKGPDFRVYVRWLRGRMTRARHDQNPSFDDPDSFFLDIDTGVLRANMGDLANYLNADVKNSPLKNMVLTGDGDQIKLKGTLHKVVPLPIELDGTITTLPENRIQVHVTKLDVLKMPAKGVLGAFHLKLEDIFNPKGIAGLEVSGNDLIFDTQELLPPPHIRGQLKRVRVMNPDLVEIYGNAQEDVERTEQWRNFLRLRGGTIDFGKLTMRYVDLIMIDISNDAWFDLDLSNYQEQLVNGYTRMTPQAGLQIFMPDLRDLPRNKTNQNISVQWMKNRSIPPPAEVYSK
jgi:hypothetical protein